MDCFKTTMNLRPGMKFWIRLQRVRVTIQDTNQALNTIICRSESGATSGQGLGWSDEEKGVSPFKRLKACLQATEMRLYVL
jgi:hypothetical protein